jgi:hypothetical protein
MALPLLERDNEQRQCDEQNETDAHDKDTSVYLRRVTSLFLSTIASLRSQ